jgi:hypothetical protein
VQRGFRSLSDDGHANTIVATAAPVLRGLEPRTGNRRPMQGRSGMRWLDQIGQALTAKSARLTNWRGPRG